MRHLRFVLLDAQDGERADLHALLVLVELRLGQVQRLLLHLHVLLGIDEFVIGGVDGGDGGDELLAQSLFGIFQPVFGDRMFSRVLSIQKFFNNGWVKVTPMEPLEFSGWVVLVPSEILPLKSYCNPHGSEPLIPELKVFPWTRMTECGGE